MLLIATDERNNTLHAETPADFDRVLADAVDYARNLYDIRESDMGIALSRAVTHANIVVSDLKFARHIDDQDARRLRDGIASAYTRARIRNRAR